MTIHPNVLIGLHNQYGISVSSNDSLVGYATQNFRIHSNKGTFILKVTDSTESTRSHAIHEYKVLEHIYSCHADIVPQALLAQNGQPYIECKVEGEQKLIRLLTYLEGDFVKSIEHNTNLYLSFGQFVGKINKSLFSFEGSGSTGEDDWDLAHFLRNRIYVDFIKSPSEKALVKYFFKQYEERVEPLRYRLRKSLIHNDANDNNVLTRNGLVIGIIDFGDMVHTWSINDLAIGLAYILMDKSEVIEPLRHVVKGFQEINPLTKDECGVLYYLIAARLCTTICHCANYIAQGTDTEYILIDYNRAQKLLQKWVSISPINIEQICLSIAGFHESTNTIEGAVSRREEFISSSLSVSYDKPLWIRQAAFQYMYDHSGRSILDAYNNIIQVGHCHPHVVEVGQRAMARLNTNTRYIYNELADYAELLLSKFPQALNKVFFVNSGSAASDLALRIAKIYTENEKLIVMEHGYHGNTIGAIEASHYKYNHKGGFQKRANVIEAEMPDSYRGRYRDLEAGPKYAQSLIDGLTSENEIAAFIAEPIIGCGGQVALSNGYLQKVYPAVREKGGLCISDEVQVGFGRLGSHFWGFEMHGVVPDIVILGKPMGNGHPMAAVVTTSEIADKFDNGMEFFSSFGGNPVSCQIGKAVLEVIESEGLQKGALMVGTNLMQRMTVLSESNPCIGDVRGSGLFIGVDIVSDVTNRTPDTGLAKKIKNCLRNMDVLVSTDGPADNVIKIKPPLCFNLENVDELIFKMDKILSSVAIEIA